MIGCGFRGVCRSLHRDQTIGVLLFQKLGKTKRWDFYHFDRLVLKDQGTGFADQATGNKNSDSKGDAKEDSCVIQTTKSQKRLQGAISKHAHHSKFIHEPAQVATRSQVEPVLLQLAPASISTSSTAPITRREPEDLYQKFGEVKVDSSRRQQRKQGRRLRET